MTIAGTVAGDDLRRAVHPDDSTSLSAQIVGSIARPAGKIEHPQLVKPWDLPGCPHISRQVHDVLCVGRIGTASFHQIVLLPTLAVRRNRNSPARPAAVHSIIDGSSSGNSVSASAGAPPARTPSTAAVAIPRRPRSTLS